jgi:hypothetical protein
LKGGAWIVAGELEGLLLYTGWIWQAGSTETEKISFLTNAIFLAPIFTAGPDQPNQK